MSTIDHHSMMQDLPYYRERYEAQKKVRVYYIPAVENETNQPTFFYALASEVLHDDMVASLREGSIPHFAVIIESGYGEPTAEIKEKIKTHYGFDHDLHANNDNSKLIQDKASAN